MTEEATETKPKRNFDNFTLPDEVVEKFGDLTDALFALCEEHDIPMVMQAVLGMEDGIRRVTAVVHTREHRLYGELLLMNMIMNDEAYAKADDPLQTAREVMEVMGEHIIRKAIKALTGSMEGVSVSAASVGSIGEFIAMMEGGSEEDETEGSIH